MLRDATRRYDRARVKLDEAKSEVVAAIVAALRTGATPTEVAATAPFTPAYVRRIAREHGIEPAAPGPKPKRGSQ